MKRLIALLVIISSMAFCADTFRVIRSGNLIKTTAPAVSALTIETATANATVSTANLYIEVTLSDGSTANLLLRQ